MINSFRFLVSVMILVSFGSLQDVSAQVTSAEKAEKEMALYLEIMKIKDPEQRIVSELELVLLGSEDQELKKSQNIQMLQSRAADSPNGMWQFDFTFSRGLSIEEVIGILESNTFDSIPMLEVKLAREDGLVQSIGFHNFDMYAGSPREVLNYIISLQYQYIQAQIESGLQVHADDLLMEKWLSNPDSIRFYRFQGRMTARNAELLRSRTSDSLMFVSMRKLPFGAGLIRMLPSQKIPMPSGKLSIEPGSGLKTKKAVPPLSSVLHSDMSLITNVITHAAQIGEQLIEFLIPSAHAAVSISCNASSPVNSKLNCPVL